MKIKEDITERGVSMARGLGIVGVIIVVLIVLWLLKII
jgi:hypothetical protein